MTFTLYTHQLGFYDEAIQFVIQSGTVEVMVGNSSQHLPLTGTFEIAGQTTYISHDKVFFSGVEIE